MGSSKPKQEVTKTKEQSESESLGTFASTGTTTQDTSQQQTADVPDWLRPFVTQATGVAGTGLTDFQAAVGGYQLPPEALAELQKTAQGGYLYGGPEQQAFIDASMRAAQPGLYSAFGAAGRAGSGHLGAQLNQSAIDAYARLYEGERGRQQSAAMALPGLSMLPLELQKQLAQLAGGLPGQFAPFLGQSATGHMAGTTSQSGTSSQTGSSSTTGQSIRPIYEDPTSQYLGLGAAGLGLLASPYTGGASAAAAPTVLSSLVGAFR